MGAGAWQLAAILSGMKFLGRSSRLIDSHEWQQHRFDFISAPKTHKTA